MLVSRFSETRGDNIATMDVELPGDGTAILFINATVQIVCPEHGSAYTNKIEGEVACENPMKLSKEDMEDLDGAIHGWPRDGHSLMWRTVRQIVQAQGDQCHKI